MLLRGHVPTPHRPGDAGGGRRARGRCPRVEGQKRWQEQSVLVISPSNRAALAHIFFIPVEGTVSADDLCHTPVLSGM